MRKFIAVIGVFFTLGFLCAKGIKFPKKVSEMLDKGLKSGEVRDDLSLSSIKNLYYPAQAGNIYFVNFIKASLPKIEKGKPSHLFLRLYDRKGKKVEDLYSPITEVSDIYSFAVSFNSKKYTLAVMVATNDLKKLSIIYKEINGGELIDYMHLGTTPVVFLKNMIKLEAAVREFRCYRGEFPLGLYMVYPYLENQFKGGETPGLFFFILGAKAKKPSNTYNINVSYEIQKDGKKITAFPRQNLNYTVVYQPISLKSHGKSLGAGDYELVIKILDLNTRKEIEKKIPFKVV